MSEAEARTEIQLLTNHTEDPALTTAQVDHLVRKAKRADSAGRSIKDAAWAPTFDIAYAVALGWEMKAQNAAGRYGFSDAGQRFEREQVVKHCRAQAQYWRGKCSGSVALPGGVSQSEAAKDA
jgi:hypothetical protein